MNSRIRQFACIINLWLVFKYLGLDVLIGNSDCIWVDLAKCPKSADHRSSLQTLPALEKTQWCFYFYPQHGYIELVRNHFTASKKGFHWGGFWQNSGVQCMEITLLMPFIEHTCAYARWALMHRFLSVRLSVCLVSLDQNSKPGSNSVHKQHSSWHVSNTLLIF